MLSDTKVPEISNYFKILHFQFCRTAIQSNQFKCNNWWLHAGPFGVYLLFVVLFAIMNSDQYHDDILLTLLTQEDFC